MIIPLTIPNREVKYICADGTAKSLWESKTLPLISGANFFATACNDEPTG